MGKRRKSIFDYLKERLLILLTADEDLVRDVIATEKSLFGSVLAVLRTFQQKDGHLVRDNDANRLMAKISRNTRRIIRESTIQKKVDAFIPNFGKVDNLTGRIYKDVIGRGAIIPDFDAARQLAIEEMLSAFSESGGLESAYIIPLQRRIFQAVQLQLPFTESVEYIRAYIRGTGPKGGDLARYSRTIATDLINGYSGFADWEVAKANDLDGFYFSGSLIDTSRQTCIDMVNGSGEFEDLAIEPGLFAVEDIPEIVRRGRDNPGWRPETTPETYPIFRNGYNCRHPLVFVPLTNEEKSTRNRVKKAIDALRSFKPDEA